MEEPFQLTIQDCIGTGTQVRLNDYSFEQFPYPDSYYINKLVLVFPNASSTCSGAAIRQITGVTHNPHGTNEKLAFSSKHNNDFNPKHGLKDVCDDAEYTGGTVMFADINEYWLDTTGNYPGLTAGVDGYIGGGTGGVLYQTHINIHNPLAMNIEDFQVQYNGNFDGDAQGTLDGFTDWNTSWTPTQVASIRQVRIWVVGKTPIPFASISQAQITGGSLYRHPGIANSPAATTDDWKKRFVLETTVTVRNMSLNLYNVGVR
jgi:hypothetical protein